jgi:membrane-associated phospholipid phosphatase
VIPHDSRAAEVRRLVLWSAVFGVGAVVAWASEPSAVELHVFHFVNGLPDILRLPLETVMVLGTFSAVLAVVAFGLLTGRRRMALAALIAAAAGSVGSHFLRIVVGRLRPVDLVRDVVVRGPRIAGTGYPSGHTSTAAALVGAVAPYLPPAGRRAAWAAVVLVAIARVYVGAHLPLDVIGGFAFGSAVSAIVNLAIPVTLPPEREPQ